MLVSRPDGFIPGEGALGVNRIGERVDPKSQSGCSGEEKIDDALPLFIKTVSKERNGVLYYITNIVLPRYVF
jgi:hypothetical protein